MPTTIPVQTDHYTDENSYPVKFLIGNFPGQYKILNSQIPDDTDKPSIVHEFDCVFFDGVEGWQLLVPKTLCVFVGRVVLHREDDLHSWWAFKGEISTVEIPGWGDL
jgi:hypothetical protein